MNEDAEESEAPAEKKKKSRKKRLSLSADADGEGTSEADASASKKKKRKMPDAGGDGEVQPKGKKGPKKGRSSYIFFSMEQRKSTEISELSFQEAGKAISEKCSTAA